MHSKKWCISFQSQCQFYNDLFRKLGLPNWNQSFLRSFKIPKISAGTSSALCNPNYTSVTFQADDDFQENKLCFNMPPRHSWGNYFGLPCSSKEPSNSEEFSSGSSGNGSETSLPLYHGIDTRLFVAPQLEMAKTDQESRRKAKPRFRFHSDRFHEFSDDEDGDTTATPFSINRSLTTGTSLSELSLNPSSSVKTGISAWVRLDTSKSGSVQPRLFQKGSAGALSETDRVLRLSADAMNQSMDFSDDDDDEDVLILDISDLEREF